MKAGLILNAAYRPPYGCDHFGPSDGLAGSQLGGHPLFQRLGALREHKVFSKGKEVADDLRERWETSDSPLVHRIQVATP